MHGVTAATVRALLVPTGRAVAWRPYLAAAGVGVTIAGFPAAVTVLLSADDLTALLRVTAVCGALGTAFLLDDRAAPSTTVVPTSRLVRHAVRAGIALPVLVIWWVTVLAVTAAAPGPAMSALPLGGLTLEAAALAALAVGLAATCRRGSMDGVVGVIAAPGVLLTVAALTFLPHWAELFVVPAAPGWEASRHRWAILLAAAVLGSVWVSREPAAGRRALPVFGRPFAGA